MKNKLVVHALKTTERAGRVNFLSVAFDGPSVALSERFRLQLVGMLEADTKTFGPLEIHTVPSRPDWFIGFTATCDESALDAALKVVANELKALIYIRPGIPIQEMTFGNESFHFDINPRVDRPSN